MVVGVTHNIFCLPNFPSVNGRRTVLPEPGEALCQALREHAHVLVEREHSAAGIPRRGVAGLSAALDDRKGRQLRARRQIGETEHRADAKYEQRLRQLRLGATSDSASPGPTCRVI